MKRIVTCMLAASMVAVGVGCGGDDDADDPAGVVETAYGAAADGDAEEACSSLSEDGLQNLYGSTSIDDCYEEIEGLSEEERASFDSLESAEQVTGDTEHCGTIEESETEAEVEATFEGDEVECIDLSLIDGEWKINDV